MKPAASSEVKLLQLSFGISIIFVIIGLILAEISDSLTLLLDALYFCVDVGVTFLSLIVIKMINRPADKRYHFGYTKFEPLMSTSEGIVMLVLCFFILTRAIQDLINPVKVTLYWLPAIFTFVAAIVSLYLGNRMKKEGKKIHSSILRAGGLLWITDAFISGGACVGFLFGHFLQNTSYKAYSTYVDPIMSLILISLLVREPIAIIRQNIRDLVDANPGTEMERTLSALVDKFCVQHPIFKRDTVRLRKSGRRLFIAVQLAVTDPKKSMDEFQHLTHELRQEILGIHPNAMIVDIMIA